MKLLGIERREGVIDVEMNGSLTLVFQECLWEEEEVEFNDPARLQFSEGKYRCALTAKPIADTDSESAK